MKGVHYIVDETGRRVAVVLDLKEHGELWEDICDSRMIEERKDEPRVVLEEVERDLGL